MHSSACTGLSTLRPDGRGTTLTLFLSWRSGFKVARRSQGRSATYDGGAPGLSRDDGVQECDEHVGKMGMRLRSGHPTNWRHATHL